MDIKIKKPFIVGIGGVAGAGKNLFAELFQKTFPNAPVSVLSFAEQLRTEMEDIVRKEFGLDVWTDDPDEKKLIRGLLVHWAHIRRELSQGNYFINHIKPKVRSAMDSGKIVLITDLRFSDFQYDEIDYVKENGVAVHIERFNKYNELILPNNDTEARNDPLIKRKANYCFQWQTMDDLDHLVKYYVSPFGKWLSYNGYITFDEV